MCVLIMAASFIADNCHSFFGDWQCEGSGPYMVNVHHYEKCDYGGGFANYHSNTWHWGFRHWVFFAFGLSMTIWSIIEIVEPNDKN